MSTLEKRQADRERKRQQRQDPDYLRQENEANAKRQAEKRAKRRKKGFCSECDRQALIGRVFCFKHMMYHRNWSPRK